MASWSEQARPRRTFRVWLQGRYKLVDAQDEREALAQVPLATRAVPVGKAGEGRVTVIRHPRIDEFNECANYVRIIPTPGVWNFYRAYDITGREVASGDSASVLAQARRAEDALADPVDGAA